MLITLTTDFGLHDSFVGIMKGVIARINAQARVLDITHGIPPQDVMAGALVLRHSASYFPRGTIHVAVVDPGVGSARRPIMIESEGNYFIGPDNGVLSLAISEQKPNQIVELTNPAYQLQSASMTFHGRDIFAPAAAHLSLGVALSDFGAPLHDYLKLNLPRIIQRADRLEGQIIYIDGFGNLFTNITQQDLTVSNSGHCKIIVGEYCVSGLSPTYEAVAIGECVAVVNSWNLLEIAFNSDSARDRVGARVGDKVQVILGT